MNIWRKPIMFYSKYLILIFIFKYIKCFLKVAEFQWMGFRFLTCIHSGGKINLYRIDRYNHVYGC